jgi:hypothetical protein
MAFHVLTAGLSPFPAELSAWLIVFAVMAGFEVFTHLSSLEILTGQTHMICCNGILNFFQLSREVPFSSSDNYP